MSNQTVKFEKNQKDSLGYRIRTIRKQCNLTLEDVAQYVGYTRQTISNYEWGTPYGLEFATKFIELINEKKPEFDLALEYLMDKNVTESSKKRMPIAAQLGFSSNAIENLFEIKRNNQIEFLSKLLATSNFPHLLITIEKNLKDKSIIESLKVNDIEKANDTLLYGIWLLDNELQQCIAELSLNDYTRFKPNYHESQLERLQTKRDTYTEKFNNLINKNNSLRN